jgi:REP element-mobilizing transposase RayT
MPQSLANFYVHIIFSTKGRRALIDAEIENALYSYLGGICNRFECFPVKIGGHNDHVHILSHFSKKITVIKFLEELKSIFRIGSKHNMPDTKTSIGKVGMVLFQ